MKKIFILSSLLTLAIANAQMKIVKFDGTATDPGTEIINESTFSFNTFDDADSKLHFKVINTSTTQPIKVKMICEGLSNSDGQYFQFCFGGYCMPFVMLESEYPPEGYSIAAGGDAGISDFLWNQKDYNNPMSATFKIFQVDDFGSEVGTPIRVKYVYNKNLAVNDISKNKSIVLKNTMVGNTLELNSKINTPFQLFDMAGKLVKSDKLTVGNNTINVQALSKGIYILTYVNDAAKSESLKIVKN